MRASRARTRRAEGGRPAWAGARPCRRRARGTSPPRGRAARRAAEGAQPPPRARGRAGRSRAFVHTLRLDLEDDALLRVAAPRIRVLAHVLLGQLVDVTLRLVALDHVDDA